MNSADENSHPQKGNILVIDSNVAFDPDSITSTRTGVNAINLLVVPWMVMLELDKNKLRPDIGHEVRESVRRIDAALLELEPNLVIEERTTFSNSRLKKDNPDHQIIATVAFVAGHTNDKKSNYFGYQKIKFLTNDKILQVIARYIFKSNPNISIEPLLKNRVSEVKEKAIRKITLGEEQRLELTKGALYLTFAKKLKLKENEPVMFVSDFDVNGKSAKKGVHFVGIKKGSRIKIIRPDIKVFNLSAMSNGKTNWRQIIAIEMVKDPEIQLVILKGGAGSGKTILALAGGLEAKKQHNCKKIVIMRLQVPLDSNYVTGILPGGVESKLAPWVLPILDNLEVLFPERNKSPEKSYEEANFSLLSSNGIFVQPLEYIKGSSFRETWVILDEAQDLTRGQIKQIISRLGKGVKIIIIGDIDQISEDHRHINKYTSGLTYAVAKLANHPLVGIITLESVVRGPLAQLAEERL